MEKIIKIVRKNPGNLDIEFVLGNTCNYKCSYCFPGSNEGTQRWPDLELTLNNFSFLLDAYKNKTRIHLKLVGGEPTLWPPLLEFVKELKSKYNIIISMSTNGSRTIRYWEEISIYFDDIQISVHHEQADVDHIIKVSDVIYETNQTVFSANVLMDPRAWDKCIGITDYLLANSSNWMIAVVPVQFNGITAYNSEQQAYVSVKNKRMPPMPWVFKLIELGKLPPDKNHNKSIATFADGVTKEVDGHYIINNQLNQFKGWECNLGVDRIFINGDGLIEGACQSSLFNDQLNIRKHDFKDKIQSIKIAPIICNKEICGCSAETRLTKQMI
jgi:organic radical activating enzyme